MNEARHEVIKSYGGNLVTLSNTIITSSYEVSLPEIRIILQFLSLIDNQSRAKSIDCNKYYRIHPEDYAVLYGVTLKVAQEQLSEAVKTLFERKLEYTDSEGKRVETRWVSSIKYTKDVGYIELAWAPGVLPYISGLKGGFTSTKMLFLTYLPSVYSMRWYLMMLADAMKRKSIYEMNLRKQNKGKSFEQWDLAVGSFDCTVYYSIEELRRIFCLQDKYRLGTDFRKYVIEEPLKVFIGDKGTKFGETRLSMVRVRGLEWKKEGRKVVGVDVKIGLVWSSSTASMAVERVREFGEDAKVSMPG